VKNHTCLIRAINILKTTYPQIRLVLVGRGYPGDIENSEEEILNIIRTLGMEHRVILTGYREDIPELLKSFDVFCLPSFSEGLPVSVLEAMAAGIPVVGSDVRGIKEVISDDETGLLFPSNNVEALALSLECLVNSCPLREALKHKAFRFVVENHGVKAWVSRYEELFQRA
jgi:glycosyltransferase involved in cell wall biosynthesis